MNGDQGTTERRAGMCDIDKRLQAVEHVVRDQLGEAGEDDGRIHRRLGGIEDTLGAIDKSLRGDNGPGLAERVRATESRQRFIIAGLGTALSALGVAAAEWIRVRLSGGG